MTGLCCTVCGTADWQRCAPGRASDALPYPENGDQGVIAFPTADVPAVAFCGECDPMVVRDERSIGVGR
jgi:hypothetical protein